ncbi:hypothetical protein Tco_1028438 [Tanacetum coccineum]|uniref:Uncharacterized protein n=1 Tax=Tanacetum coccineum TaxID=301880 RepID=A0ABQ5G0P1_9ASTR
MWHCIVYYSSVCLAFLNRPILLLLQFSLYRDALSVVIYSVPIHLRRSLSTWCEAEEQPWYLLLFHLLRTRPDILPVIPEEEDVEDPEEDLTSILLNIGVVMRRMRRRSTSFCRLYSCRFSRADLQMTSSVDYGTKAAKGATDTDG